MGDYFFLLPFALATRRPPGPYLLGHWGPMVLYFCSRRFSSSWSARCGGMVGWWDILPLYHKNTKNLHNPLSEAMYDVAHLAEFCCLGWVDDVSSVELCALKCLGEFELYISKNGEYCLVWSKRMKVAFVILDSQLEWKQIKKLANLNIISILYP